MLRRLIDMAHAIIVGEKCELCKLPDGSGVCCSVDVRSCPLRLALLERKQQTGSFRITTERDNRNADRF